MCARTYLEDKETIMVQIDSFTLEKGSDLFTIRCAAIDLVLARAIWIRYPRHSKLWIRDNSVRVRSRLLTALAERYTLNTNRRHTKSTISLKWTSTLHSVRLGWLAELWMSSASLPWRSLEARFPNTNNRASIVFDFPDPLGPTIAENDCGWS